MIRVINLDPNSDNYIMNKDGERIRHLDDATLSRIVYINGHGSSEITWQSDLMKQFCGMYYTEKLYEDDNAVYYFDDGYYNKMINSGYIVLNNYDGMKAPKELGDTISKKLFFKIHETFEMLPHESIERIDEKEKDPVLIVKINSFPYEYTIRCRSTTSLSEANQMRKINNLPYYPFDVRMDKYGTYYIACYAKLQDDVILDDLDNVTPPDKYIMNLLMNFMQKINNESKSDIYHYEPVKAKKPVIYSERNDI
jgi:hypothetical protein